MKILIIPDVHGSHEWEVAKERVAEVDKVVFLGDFFLIHGQMHGPIRERILRTFATSKEKI